MSICAVSVWGCHEEPVASVLLRGSGAHMQLSAGCLPQPELLLTGTGAGPASAGSAEQASKGVGAPRIHIHVTFFKTEVTVTQHEINHVEWSLSGIEYLQCCATTLSI